MFSRKIAVQMSGILRVAYMHAMSLNAYASQAAINAGVGPAAISYNKSIVVS